VHDQRPFIRVRSSKSPHVHQYSMLPPCTIASPHIWATIFVLPVPALVQLQSPPIGYGPCAQLVRALAHHISNVFHGYYALTEWSVGQLTGWKSNDELRGWSGQYAMRVVSEITVSKTRYSRSCHLVSVALPHAWEGCVVRLINVWSWVTSFPPSSHTSPNTESSSMSPPQYVNGNLLTRLPK